MIAVVILGLLMIPVFFVSVQRWLARDRETVPRPASETYGSAAPVQGPAE
jgi:multidrug efflux pump